MKFAKDSSLLDRKVNGTVVDLIFAKVKIKGQHSIGFEAFRDGLVQLAFKKGVPYTQLVDSAVEGKGPVTSGTKASAVKFHDERIKIGNTKGGNAISAATEGESYDFGITPRDRGSVSLLRSRSEGTALQSRGGNHRDHAAASGGGDSPRSRVPDSENPKEVEGGLSSRATNSQLEMAAAEAGRRASDLARSLGDCQSQLRGERKKVNQLEAERDKYQLDRCTLVARLGELEAEAVRSRANSEKSSLCAGSGGEQGTHCFGLEGEQGEGRWGGKGREAVKSMQEDSSGGQPGVAAGVSQLARRAMGLQEAAEGERTTTAVGEGEDEANAASPVGEAPEECRITPQPPPRYMDSAQLGVVVLKQLGAILWRWERGRLRAALFGWHCAWLLAHAKQEGVAIAASALEAEERALAELEALQDESSELATELAAKERELQRFLAMGSSSPAASPSARA